MADAPKEIRLIECENLIKQIRDVISVTIASNDQKEIEEIHVLAEDTRNAKQLVRDIETLLRVEYGLDLDHKKISIVQLGKDQKLFQGKRLQFSSIQYSQKGTKIEAVVELISAKRASQGKRSGANSRSNRLKLFAEATLEAVAEFLDTGSSVILEEVSQFTMADRFFVCTALTYMSGKEEEFLLGSALVKTDEREAVVRATLAALNRRIPVDRKSVV